MTEFYTKAGTDAAISAAIVAGSGGSAPDATTTSKGIVQLAGDLTGTAALPALAAAGTAGTYGDSTHVPVFTTDSKGRVTSVTPTTITGAAPTGAAGGDLTGTFPNPTLAAAGTAGTYGDSTHVPVFTTDAKGRVTSVTPTVITGAAPTGTAGGDLTGTYPNPTLAAAGTAGTYGSATAVPVVTTDAKGRVTSVTTAAPSDTARLRWEGTWTATTVYAVNDVVTHSGSAYACLTAHTSGSSFSGPGTNWAVIAQGVAVGTTAPTTPLTNDVWVDAT